MSNASFLVTYVGDGVVNLGKAGTFGRGTSAYVTEEVASELSRDKNWQVTAPGGQAPRATAPAAKAEKVEPAKVEKKAEEKKPAEKPKEEKKAEEPKKAEAAAD